MPVLPGHYYIGPGNEIDKDIKQPIDFDDLIALKHDIKYQQAKNPQDIIDADNEAIGEFLSDVQNPHSVLGAIGLSTKKIADHFLGKPIIYPNLKKQPMFVPNKRLKHDETQLETPLEENNESSGNIAPMQEPQAGGSIAGGTGSSIGNDNVLTTNLSSTASITFENCFQIYSGAFQFSRRTDTFFSRVPGTDFFSTPLCVINPSLLCLYMNVYQFKELPKIAYATHAEINITPLGYRLPFATNEAASGYANSQTVVQIAKGIGLERHIPMAVVGYSNTDSDPTSIEGFNENIDLESSIWGNKTQIGAVTGIPRHYNQYASVMQSTGATGSPMLLKFIDVYNCNDVKGSNFIQYKYDFKNGLLTSPTTYGDINNILSQQELLLGVYRGPITTTIKNQKLQTEQLQYPDTNNFGYWDLIEKSYFFSNTLGQEQSPRQPPLIYFGVFPVQSNAALTSKATFSPAVVMWKVSTKLNVRINTNYMYDSMLSTMVYNAISIRKPQLSLWGTMYVDGHLMFQYTKISSSSKTTPMDDENNDESIIPITPSISNVKLNYKKTTKKFF